VGYVGEENGFFRGWNARHNPDFLAKLIPGWSKDRARRLAARFGLPMGKPVNKLSRGNQTKLALVAALAHGPKLLLLDEPTAGLDPVVRSEVLDVLWEITEDGEHAVLYSTHVLSDINRLADELAFLRDGQLVLRTGRDELSESWRRVSFRLQDEEVELFGIVEHSRVRAEHQVITRDAEATLQQLNEVGAEAIEVSRMSVDEIAVQILKEGHHVARAES
jgi:ABC-2 type transport system ATP-binding protein